MSYFLKKLRAGRQLALQCRAYVRSRYHSRRRFRRPDAGAFSQAERAIGERAAVAGKPLPAGRGSDNLHIEEDESDALAEKAAPPKTLSAEVPEALHPAMLGLDALSRTISESIRARAEGGDRFAGAAGDEKWREPQHVQRAARGVEGLQGRLPSSVGLSSDHSRSRFAVRRSDGNPPADFRAVAEARGQPDESPVAKN